MKFLLAALVTLLLALQYRLWFGDGSVQELWRVREEARATRAEVVRLRGRNQALRAEVADLKSGLDAVEERARTDLGMIDEDELFYQFVREQDAAVPARAVAPGDRAEGSSEPGPAGDVVDGAESASIAASAGGASASEILPPPPVASGAARGEAAPRAEPDAGRDGR